MLAHIDSNKCKDRSGLVSQSVLSKGRINAALEVERLSSMGSIGQPGTGYGSVDLSTEGGGGVLVQESLIDRDDYAVDQGVGWSDEIGINTEANAEGPAHHASEPSDDNTESETRKSQDWPRVSKSNQDRPGRKSMVEGLNNLSIAGSNTTASTLGWSQALFPEGTPTPVTGGWTRPSAQPSVVHGGRGTFDETASSSQFLAYNRQGKRVRTDWDRYVFERDPMGKYKCPFQRCK